MSVLTGRLSTMKIRLLQCLVLFTALALTACPTTDPKKKDKKAASRPPEVTELNADVDFQAFIGRLRKAVAARDMNTIASMMMPNFWFRPRGDPGRRSERPGRFPILG